MCVNYDLCIVCGGIIENTIYHLTPKQIEVARQEKQLCECSLPGGK